MTEKVIEIKNISKQYRLGKIGTASLADDFKRWWATMRGKENPFLNTGEENVRDKTGGSDYVWALKDINFSVNKGEVVAIIGKNGAGKSTLLKILSQVTEPTTGEVKIKGRVASLLEVGTGFHPDLSGRENIFLNGAILGMTKSEIKSKFNDIVEFSGVQKYIDTPVKRYSSGMKVRLGFAVAAHLEPEILIVDEVLAVGDAEFQTKCLGKMQDVAGSGRTVLFVSHNLSAVRNLCQRGIVLKNGLMSFDGLVEDAVNHYTSSVLPVQQSDSSKIIFTSDIDAPFQMCSAILINDKEENSSKFEFNVEVVVRVKVLVKEKRSDSLLGVIVEDTNGNMILVSTSDEAEKSLIQEKSPGEYIVDISLPNKILKPGIYHITLSARGKMDNAYQKAENCLSFEVVDTLSFRSMKNLYRKQAVIAPEIVWTLNSVEQTII